jgi:transcriptional regulator with XRE-family HTH domain
MKVTVKGKIKAGKKKFGAAILSLRRALGETQEGMGRQIGCSFAAYRKWESGISSPGGEWLIRLLALCPDDETRGALALQTGISSVDRRTDRNVVVDKSAHLKRPGLDTGAESPVPSKARLT